MAKKQTADAPAPPTSNGEANGHAPTSNGDWTDEQRARFIDEAVGTITQNEQSMRSQLFDRLLGRRRKIDEECDYPPPGADSIGLYKELYDRNPIAARVVQVLPMASWQVTPLVYETDDDDNETEFEKDWDAVSAQLAAGGSKSWHRQEQGGIVWDYLRRLDILSGIGHFGILLLGIDDGRNLQDPADGAVVVANGQRYGALVTNAGAYPDGYLDEKDEGALDTLATAPGKRHVWTHNDEHGKPQYRQVEVPVLNADERAVLAAWKQERSSVKQLVENKVIDHVSEVEGTDRQYSEFGSLGMGMPPASDLSGTDAQYFVPMLGQTEQPGDEPSKKKHKLLFVRPFDESLVQVVRYEWNVRNPRFGQPVMYRVTLNDPSDQHSGVGLPLATVFVHWSRVVHVPADDQGSSEIMGPPRMRCGLNDLLDIRKLFASSAEGYWQSCFTALSIETHPQLGGDVKIDKEQMRDMMQEFRNRLRRDIFLKGMSAKTLAPVVVDPTPFILGHIEALCIKIPCPKRVFMGSERGELASSQDDSQWNDTVRARQNLRCTPRIIAPFIDRLIMLGCVSEPGEDGYTVEWPDLDSLGKLQQADLATKVTQAIVAYMGGNGEAFMPVLNYMVKVLGWTEEEATEYVEAAALKMEEDLAEQQALADEQGFEPQPPEGFAKPEPEVPQPPIKVKEGEKLVSPDAVENADDRSEHDVYADEVRRLEGGV